MTAYELLTSLPESVLSSLICVLDSKRIYYGKRLIFDNDRFTALPFETEDGSVTLDKLNSVPLIERRSGEEKQEVWVHTLAELYSAYFSCYPRQCSFVNFKHPKVNELDLLQALPYFYQYKARLELYVLFHGVQKDLEWNNADHFFEKITDGCIVYRRWLV